MKKRQREFETQQREEQQKKQFRNSFLENVNKNSDDKLIKVFHEEYYSIINGAKQQNMNLYLMDILGQMKFIDEEILLSPNFNNPNDRYRKLKVLLRNQNNNLLVVSNQEDYPQDIAKNLFKVLCAIFNLKAKQTGLYIMDEELLEQYCEQIESNKFSSDETFIA